MASSTQDKQGSGGGGTEQGSSPTEGGVDQQATTTGDTNKSITNEELTELIRAILFANSDSEEGGMSQRAVYREITEKLSTKPGFEYLKNVKEGDVRKCLKLAKQQQQQSSSATNENSKNKDLLDLIPSKDKLLQVFTVGDGNILQLAEEVKAAAISSAAEQAAAKSNGEATNFVHVFLDVSADQSGGKPHQALINFQFSNGSSSSNKKKKGGKKSATQNTNVNPDEVIVKIQRALPEEGDTTKHPMLLYDQSRKWKTFIHPEKNSDRDETGGSGPNDNAYDTIYDMIGKEGKEGALGNLGGTKSYFNAIVSKKNRIISIDVSKLAPNQDW
jgi:hypothetical protein